MEDEVFPKSAGIVGSIGKGSLGLAAKHPVTAIMGGVFLPSTLAGVAHAGKKHKDRAKNITQQKVQQLTPRKLMPQYQKYAFDLDEIKQTQKIASVLLRKQKEVSSTSLDVYGKSGELYLSKIASAGKLKGIWSALKGLKSKEALGIGASLAAGAALVGSAQGLITHGAGSAYEGTRVLGRERQYKRMLKADPTLKEDPRARQMFGVIHRASPYLSKEPVLAAAVVRQMTSAPSFVEGGIPHIPPALIRDVLSLQESRQKTKYPAIQSSLGSSPMKPMDIASLASG